MVNPGAFQGSRREFLLSQKKAYSEGVAGGYAGDALSVIQRLYFKRYPVDLPHDEEPDPEALASIDYDAPDAEQEEPDESRLGAEGYTAAMEALEARGAVVAYRKAQIQRWMAYQYMKDHDMDPKESGAHNPYRVLLHKLTGTTIQCPRRRTAVNVWRKTQREIIEQEVKRRAATLGTKLKGLAALRDKVAKEFYAKLNDTEKAGWETQAKEEHDEAVAKWKSETQGGFSSDPAERQKCIYGLINFFQPILDLVSDATGWKTTLVAGGPEPAHGGRLNVISVHSGSTLGDVKMNFGRAERLRFKNTLVPIFGQFLQKCYTPEECRACALSPEEGFEKLESMDLEGADFDTITADTTQSNGYTIVASSSTAAKSTSASATRGQALSLKHPQPARSCSRPLSPGPSPMLSPQHRVSRSRSRSLSQAPSPISPFNLVSNPPSPSSVSSILRDELPPSPNISPCAIASTDSNVATSASIPIATATSNAHGKKRHADASLPRPKRARVAPGAAKPGSSQVPPLIEVNDAANRVSTAKATHTTPKAPSRKSNRPPPSARATRSATTAGDMPSTISPGPVEQSLLPTTSNQKLEAARDAPAWFSKALAMLQCDDADLGLPWKELIGLWAAFEIKEGYGCDVGGKLKAKHRPTVVGDWIQRARLPSWRPVISNVAATEEGFSKWWTSLQPEWRIGDSGEVDMAARDGDWEPLRQPGINGVLSILAGLFFWGLAVHGNAAACQEWSRFIDDCILMFNGLLTI